MVKIYVSSTYEDLKEYREAVYHALRRMRHDVIGMEDYVAQGQKPLQSCLEDVASCDIYIGIFAWRYGFIPDDKKDNPNGLSITELEYGKACDFDIPCLIFLLDDDISWPRSLSDGTAQSGIKSDDNINRLRNGFKNDYVISKFKNKDELAGLVVTAVYKVLQDQKFSSGRFFVNEDMQKITLNPKVNINTNQYLQKTIEAVNEDNVVKFYNNFRELIQNPEIYEVFQKAINTIIQQKQEKAIDVIENPTFYDSGSILEKGILEASNSLSMNSPGIMLGGIKEFSGVSKEEELNIHELILRIYYRLIKRLKEEAKTLAIKLDAMEKPSKTDEQKLVNMMNYITTLYNNIVDLNKK